MHCPIKEFPAPASSVQVKHNNSSAKQYLTGIFETIFPVPYCRRLIHSLTFTSFLSHDVFRFESKIQSGSRALHRRGRQRASPRPGGSDEAENVARGEGQDQDGKRLQNDVRCEFLRDCEKVLLTHQPTTAANARRACTLSEQRVRDLTWALEGGRQRTVFNGLVVARSCVNSPDLKP